LHRKAFASAQCITFEVTLFTTIYGVYEHRPFYGQAKQTTKSMMKESAQHAKLPKMLIGARFV